MLVPSGVLSNGKSRGARGRWSKSPVDIADFKRGYLRDAQARRVHSRRGGPVLHIGDGIEEAGDFRRGEHGGQDIGTTGERPCRRQTLGETLYSSSIITRRAPVPTPVPNRHQSQPCSVFP